MRYLLFVLEPKQSQPLNNVHGKRSVLVDDPSRNTGIKGILKTTNLRHSDLKAPGPNRRLLRSKSPTNRETSNSRASANVNQYIDKKRIDTCKQCNCVDCRLQNNSQKVGGKQNAAYSYRQAKCTPRPRSADASHVGQPYPITAAKHYQHLTDSSGLYSQTVSNSSIYEGTQPIPQRNAIQLRSRPQTPSTKKARPRTLHLNDNYGGTKMTSYNANRSGAPVYFEVPSTELSRTPTKEMSHKYPHTSSRNFIKKRGGSKESRRRIVGSEVMPV